MIRTGRQVRRSTCWRCVVSRLSTFSVSRTGTVKRDSFVLPGARTVSTHLLWLSSNETSTVPGSDPGAVGWFCGWVSIRIGCSLVVWEAYRTRSSARPPPPPAWVLPSPRQSQVLDTGLHRHDGVGAAATRWFV